MLRFRLPDGPKDCEAVAVEPLMVSRPRGLCKKFGSRRAPVFRPRGLFHRFAPPCGSVARRAKPQARRRRASIAETGGSAPIKSLRDFTKGGFAAIGASKKRCSSVGQSITEIGASHLTMQQKARDQAFVFGARSKRRNRKDAKDAKGCVFSTQQRK